MTQAEARDYIREHSREYADAHWGRDKSGKGWICPVCGSGQGEGKHGAGTGITSKDGGQHFTCWAQGCFSNADVIDIIGLVENIPETDYTRKFEAARRAFGIELDEPRKPGSRNPYPPASPKTTGFAPTAASRGKLLLGGSHGGGQLSEDVMKALGALNAIAAEANPTATEPPAAPQSEPKQQGENLESFFLEAAKRIAETSYHRGLSLETLKKFRIGYVAAWTDGKIITPTPRLILPYAPDYYEARFAGPDSAIASWDSKYKRHGKGQRVFNVEALKTASGPVFVTEGVFDCLSISDVAGKAATVITAGSAANWAAARDAIKATPPRYPVIVAFDNDKTGQEKGEDLRKALGAAGIRFQDYEPPNGAKDANEALMTDRAAFEASVKAAIDEAMSKGEQEPGPPSLQAEGETNAAAAGEPVKESGQDAGEPQKAPMTAEEYRAKFTASGTLQSVIDAIRMGEQYPAIPTGFAKLDEILNGGFRPGLYVLGAIQSLGKTALSMQIADAVAAQGHDVLIFALEMSRKELVFRSLSRETYELSKRLGSPGKYAYSTVTLMGGGFSDSEAQRHISAAAENYTAYSDNIYLFEGLADISVSMMAGAVEGHIKLTGRKPGLVLVDYLQITKAETDKAGRRPSDKQANDDNILALKRLSRDSDVPILVISSFNRENYAKPVNASAFKESGAIEYSADVLLAAQYFGLDYEPGDENEQQRARRVSALIREWEATGKKGKAITIQLKILKNRRGAKGEMCLSYLPAFNCFEGNAEADRQAAINAEAWSRVVKEETEAARRKQTQERQRGY